MTEPNDRTVLVAVSDIFFYTKVRDALLPAGYKLERVRTQEDVTVKRTTSSPCAAILNMNEERLDPFQALSHLRDASSGAPVPVLAFANHEETDTWRRAKELGVTKIVSRNEFSARTFDLVQEVIQSERPKVGKS